MKIADPTQFIKYYIHILRFVAFYTIARQHQFFPLNNCKVCLHRLKNPRFRQITNWQIGSIFREFIFLFIWDISRSTISVSLRYDTGRHFFKSCIMYAHDDRVVIEKKLYRWTCGWKIPLHWAVNQINRIFPLFSSRVRTMSRY